MEFLSHSAEETEELGITFSKQLQPGDVITLDGDLGAGKTAFARGILRGLGYNGRVTSPTFAVANEYQTECADVVHFDMYRILDAEALWELGFSEYLNDEYIVLIEWSDNIAQALPTQYRAISIAYGETPDRRIITIKEAGI